jgi:hypothetical protein
MTRNYRNKNKYAGTQRKMFKADDTYVERIKSYQASAAVTHPDYILYSAVPGFPLTVGKPKIFLQHKTNVNDIIALEN